MTRILLAVLLALPAGTAGAQWPVQPRTFTGSKLDLPLFPTLKRATPRPINGAAFGWRFDSGRSGWSAFASAANTGLFSLAVVNFFAPWWLPRGAAGRLNLNGRGWAPPLPDRLYPPPYP